MTHELLADMEKQGRNKQSFGSCVNRLRQALHSLVRRAPQPAAKRASRPSNHAPDPAGRILIVELGGWTCGTLPRLLGQHGHETQVVQEQEAAFEILDREDPVLVVVGGTANLDLYHGLRQVSLVPILAIVPVGDAAQAVAAFAAGVDQYQVGPISDGETVVWARATLRRAAQPPPTFSERGTR